MVEMTDISFVIIGAAKSATTWLQRSLQADPDVFMPGPELHFFSREFHRGEAWYLANFSSQALGRHVGEKSNSYLDNPAAAARLRAALPHAKLVAQLRNPVDRAYSDYCMLFRRGEVSGDIEHHLDPRSAVEGRFLAGGFYYRQLSAYQELYPASQVSVLLYDDMQIDALAQLNRVRRFLGLRPAESVPVAQGRVKDKGTPVIGPRLRQALSPFKPLVRSIRHRPSFQRFRGLFAREPSYPELSGDLRRRLLDFYAPEIEALGKLIDRDLNLWLGSRSAAPSTRTQARNTGHQ
jgi:hypothetical protein